VRVGFLAILSVEIASIKETVIVGTSVPATSGKGVTDNSSRSWAFLISKLKEKESGLFFSVLEKARAYF
jgi:hypothetical protein